VIIRLSLELADIAVNGGLELGPVSSWVAAGATFLAVIVALFGQRMWECLRRPRLDITFEHAEPFCRKTRLAKHWQAYWVRVKVENKGADPARACVGKLSKVYTDGTFRDDRDPVQLRWCGVPDHRGFEAIHLARRQYEFLNVFRIHQRERQISIETFPDYAPGVPTALEPNLEHRVEISVVADNAHPKTATLTVTYNGDFHRLPNSLTATLGNRMRRS
jgi:hypothetical protein